MSKKKKDKKPGKASGPDEALPPPPNLDEHAYGAQDGVLMLKIQNKENQVCQYAEEAEVFKERNYKQKEYNYQLRQERATHLKTLVQKSRQYIESLDQAVPVTREQVEQALVEKFSFSREAVADIRRLQCELEETEEQLQLAHVEAGIWRDYRDRIQHEKAAYIRDMKAKMDIMSSELVRAEDVLRGDLERMKRESMQKMEILVEKQKRVISEGRQQTMDSSTLTELRDNSWLHKEVAMMQKSVQQLREVVDTLERQNIELIEKVQNELMKDLEATRMVYKASRRKGQFYSNMGSSGNGNGILPSLTESDSKLPGGQAGHDELGVLMIHGSKAVAVEAEESLHLPLIEQQHGSHASLVQRTNWPVTSTMLRSIA